MPARGWCRYSENVADFASYMEQGGTLALREASQFFQSEGHVFSALRKITSRLDELGIAYAVAGGMALFHHG